MGVYIVISVLILIACILMVLVVLVQNSKGGGLASTFSSSNQIMGVRRTADFLEKFTWILAISLLVLSLISFMSIPKNSGKKVAETELRDKMSKTPQQQPVKDYQQAPQQQNQQQNQEQKK
jgi:preprotein translocase subunit SecG